MLSKAIRYSVQLVPWRFRTIVKKLPLLGPFQRWISARFLNGTEFVCTINAGPARGLTTVVKLPEDKGIWTGTYEHDFVSALAKAVRPGDVCFDIGGWHGFCAGVMAVQGASQTVIFEPMRNNCERIRKMMSLNPSLNIRLESVAVGDSDGAANFCALEADSMGKLESSSFQAEVKSSTTIEVDVVSLDSWCGRNSFAMPNLIKIDVEGAEWMVLKGALRVLRTATPKLFIEAHSRELTAQVTSFLVELGYYVRCMETDQLPDGVREPEVCHLSATWIG